MSVKLKEIQQQQELGKAANSERTATLYQHRDEIEV